MVSKEQAITFTESSFAYPGQSCSLQHVRCATLMPLQIQSTAQHGTSFARRASPGTEVATAVGGPNKRTEGLVIPDDTQLSPRIKPCCHPTCLSHTRERRNQRHGTPLGPNSIARLVLPRPGLHEAGYTIIIIIKVNPD